MRVRSISIQVLIFTIFFTSQVQTIAPTIEEQELLKIAREHHHPGVKDFIEGVKHGWSVLEYFHKGVELNKRVALALTECWQHSYMRDDSSYSIKITDHEITRIFEQFLIELQSHISYYEKQKALGRFKNDLYYFSREGQAEYRPTIEKGQRIILKNLKEYIPLKMRQDIETSTERVFKDGIRFLLYVLLTKHNKGFTKDDVGFINAKMRMFLNEVGRDYPYISVMQFECWVCSLIQDLLFSECVICMDNKGEQYMRCCKTKSICKKCYAYISSCPLCCAPKK